MRRPFARRWLSSGLLALGLLVGCGAPTATDRPASPTTAATATPSPTNTPSQPTPTIDIVGQLTLPPGFTINIYARDLGEVRSVAFDAAGVPYVTVMNRHTRRGGLVLALPDTNKDGQADRTVVVAKDLERPHGIVFHNGDLYISEPDTIWRLRDTNGDLVADTQGPVVTDMPASGDHWSRPFVFDQDGSILVAVGSHCNMCQEGDKQRATILRYTTEMPKPDDYRPGFYARGLRSVVGLTWRPGSGELWAANNGPDHLGPQIPPDQLFRLEQDGHYGWPYCYGDRTPDPAALQDESVVTPDRSPKADFCQTQVEPPALLLPTHSAPLGMAFYQGGQFPEDLQGSLFVALHGAYDYVNTLGYRVIRIPFTDGQPGPPVDFISGWARPTAQRWDGRPVGLAFAPDGSMFVTDDANGYLYQVSFHGAAAAATP